MKQSKSKRRKLGHHIKECKVTVAPQMLAYYTRRPNKLLNRIKKRQSLLPYRWIEYSDRCHTLTQQVTDYFDTRQSKLSEERKKALQRISQKSRVCEKKLTQYESRLVADECILTTLIEDQVDRKESSLRPSEFASIVSRHTTPPMLKINTVLKSFRAPSIQPAQLQLETNKLHMSSVQEVLTSYYDSISPMFNVDIVGLITLYTDDATINMRSFAGKCVRMYGPRSSRRRYHYIASSGYNVIVLDGSLVNVWDCRMGKHVRRITLCHNQTIFAIATVEADQIVCVSSDKIRLFCLKSGQCLRSFGQVRRAFQPHRVFQPYIQYGGCTNLQVFSDKRRVLVCGVDTNLRIWDIETGKCLQILSGHTAAAPRCGVVVGDGRLVASAGCTPDQSVRVWDVETGTCVHVLMGDDESVCSLAVVEPTSGGDGITRLVSGHLRSTRVWDVDTGTCLRAFNSYFPTRMSIHTLTSLGNGRQIIGNAGHNTLAVFDVISGDYNEVTHEYGAPIKSLFYAAAIGYVVLQLTNRRLCALI